MDCPYCRGPLWDDGKHVRCARSHRFLRELASGGNSAQLTYVGGGVPTGKLNATFMIPGGELFEERTPFAFHEIRISSDNVSDLLASDAGIPFSQVAAEELVRDALALGISVVVVDAEDASVTGRVIELDGKLRVQA